MIPPSIKKLVPSLKIANGKKAGQETATIDLGDLKKLFPTLEVSVDSEDPLRGSATMSVDDLRKILGVALADVEVDAAWYVTQVPNLRQALQRGNFKSVEDHYVKHGYLEARLPVRPIVDEKFYLKNNPDVASGIQSGDIKSGFDHYVRNGYAEGRPPKAPIK